MVTEPGELGPDNVLEQEKPSGGSRGLMAQVRTFNCEVAYHVLTFREGVKRGQKLFI